MNRSEQPPRPAGAVAVEYALILPVLLVMLLGALDVGRLAWLQVTLERAVAAAARCAAINTTTCGTTSQIQNYAAAQAFGTTLPASVFTPTSASCGRKVTGAVPFAFVTPLPTKLAVTLTAAACYPVQ